MALNTNEFANLVRNWVHYDNLATNLNRQVQNARKLKDEFEQQIIGMLKGSKMEKAVIQIAGGRLLVGEEKHTNPLTITRIEELLHAYYGRKPVGTTDETPEIMKFLRSQRGFETNLRLKKQTN
jgi:hypothetical protein